MSQNQFYTGVVCKKYKLFCVAPDGAQVEIMEIQNEEAGKTASLACQKILELMQDSFDMEEGFTMKLESFMQSADEVPLMEVNTTH